MSEVIFLRQRLSEIFANYETEVVISWIAHQAQKPSRDVLKRPAHYEPKPGFLYM